MTDKEKQEKILKSISAFSKEEVATILTALGEREQDQHSQCHKDMENPQSAKQKISDLYDSVFATDEQYAQASYDRKMLRIWLEKQALAGNEQCAQLHKQWDGAGYAIYNNWLFGDTEEDQTVELEFINKDGSTKSLKIKVSL